MITNATSTIHLNTRQGRAWPNASVDSLLSFAAAPTFAMMALATICLGGGIEPICSATQQGSLVSGMVPMYLLMSAFHSAPWLRLCSGVRGRGGS